MVGNKPWGNKPWGKRNGLGETSRGMSHGGKAGNQPKSIDRHWHVKVCIGWCLMRISMRIIIISIIVILFFIIITQICTAQQYDQSIK